MATQGFPCSGVLQDHVKHYLDEVGLGGSLEKESNSYLHLKVWPRCTNINLGTFTSVSISGCSDFRGHRAQRGDHSGQEPQILGSDEGMGKLTSAPLLSKERTGLT